jgi:hypothetical protein
MRYSRLLAAAVICLLPAAGLAETYTAGGPAGLKALLGKVRGGDTILLEPGRYGTLALTQDFDSDVTIRSAQPLRAVFGGITIMGASHIVLDGLRVDGEGVRGNYIEIDKGADHITIRSSEIGAASGYDRNFGIRAKSSTNLSYLGNYVHNAVNGIANFHNNDVTLIGNVIDWMASDSFKFSGVNRGLVEGNWGAAHVEAAPGAHVDFMQFQGEDTRNMVIRGNVLLPAEGTDGTAQGIFGNLSDSLIEQNIIVSALVRGISVHTGNTIRYNTLLDIPGQAVDDTKIWWDSGTTVDYNIWTESKGGVYGTNVIVQHNDPRGVNYVYNLIPNFHGTGTTLQDLIPVTGSIVDGLGAHEELLKLLREQ